MRGEWSKVLTSRLRDAGDPVEIARRYDQQGADEITSSISAASSGDRDLILPMIEAVASQVLFLLRLVVACMRSQMCVRLLNAGADKVGVNTSAVTNPQLVADAAHKYGSMYRRRD